MLHLCSFNRLGLISLAFMGVLPFQVSAALISSDYQNVSDNLITIDTVTKLEWLDFSKSYNRSYTDVSAKLGGGGEFAGFTYATGQQVFDLYRNNIPSNPYSESTDPSNYYARYGYNNYYFGEVNSLLAIGNGTVYGFVADQSSDSSKQKAVHLRHESRSCGFNGYSFGCSYHNDQISGGMSEFDKSTSLGHFLIRAPSSVPVPATIWLFGTALIGLVGFSKRKSKVAA